MEPLNSELLQADQRLRAKKNARDIQKQILKLVRLFSSKQMMDKLKKEFNPRSQSQNDVAAYLEVYKDMKKLWMQRLCTPLEEVQSIKEQLARLDKSVEDLEKVHKQKEEAYQKYQEQTKEHRMQLQKELEELGNAKTQRLTEQHQIQANLVEKGDETAQKKDEIHQQKKVQLQKDIERLEKELKEVREKNKGEEEKLTGAFQAADRTYVDALQNYD